MILFLGKENIPLRGHIEKGDNNNGNFRGLVNLLKKYNAVLTDHIVNRKEKCSLYHTSP